MAQASRLRQNKKPSLLQKLKRRRLTESSYFQMYIKNRLSYQ